MRTLRGRTRSTSRAETNMKSKSCDKVLDKAYRELFDEIDADGNGKIDVAELNTVVTTLFPDQKFSKADIMYMIEEADLNHDGLISYEEFCDVMKKAEGKKSLWGDLTLWGRTQKSLNEFRVTLNAARRPLKEWSRQLSKKNSGTNFPDPSLRAIGMSIATIMSVLCSFLLLHIITKICWSILSGYEVWRTDMHRTVYGRLKDSASESFGKFITSKYFGEDMEERVMKSLNLDFDERLFRVYTLMLGDKTSILTTTALNLLCAFHGQTFAFWLMSFKLVKSNGETCGILDVLMFNIIDVLDHMVKLYENFMVSPSDVDTKMYIATANAVLLAIGGVFNIILLFTHRYPTEYFFNYRVVA